MPPQRSETHPHMVPGLTMCGSVVENLGSESSFSTLGCVIKIDSAFYAITSRHAFSLFEPRKELLSGEMSGHQPVDHSSAGTSTNGTEKRRVCDCEPPLCGPDTNPSDTLPDDNGYLIDDVVYESLTDNDQGVLEPVDSRSAIANASHGNQKHTSGQTRELQKMPALLPTPDELDESGELDLDWALIKLVDQQDWRPNAFFYPSVSSSPMFLSQVVKSQPTKETPVLILTGGPTPQRGMLQPGISLLGGINGRTPSRMWTVVLTEKNSEFITIPFLRPRIS
jgi:hypothetical protein